VDITNSIHVPILLFFHRVSAFFLLAKKSRYAESWLVYFWRERLPLATEGSFSPEGKTLQGVHIYIISIWILLTKYDHHWLVTLRTVVNNMFYLFKVIGNRCTWTISLIGRPPLQYSSSLCLHSVTILRKLNCAETWEESGRKEIRRKLASSQTALGEP
jgi:hypothetical protein